MTMTWNDIVHCAGVFLMILTIFYIDGKAIENWDLLPLWLQSGFFLFNGAALMLVALASRSRPTANGTAFIAAILVFFWYGLPF